MRSEKPFLIDIRDIENFKPARAVRGVEIFAAQDDIQNLLAAMMIALPGNCAPRCEMLSVIGRIGDLVQMTADRRLAVPPVRSRPRHEILPAFADVGVAPEEIHRARAEAEQRRHPRIVVVLFGEMAIGAALGCADAARGVREMRIERLAAVTFRGNGLLLRINPFAIRILRADHDRARRADHRQSILFHRAVDAEHENVVAHDLRIVGGEIAVGDAFKFVLRRPLVRVHRQMATETTRRP